MLVHTPTPMGKPPALGSWAAGLNVTLQSRYEQNDGISIGLLEIMILVIREHSSMSPGTIRTLYTECIAWSSYGDCIHGRSLGG